MINDLHVIAILRKPRLRPSSGHIDSLNAALEWQAGLSKRKPGDGGGLSTRRACSAAVHAPLARAPPSMGG